MGNNETQKNESTAHGDTSLLALAENILEQTKVFTRYLQSNNLAEPTFSPRSSEPPITDEYLELQSSLRTSLDDLQRLVDGPRRFLRSYLGMGYDITALQIALDFGFFELVPSDGDISMEDLAEKANLDLDRVSRVVRMLITHRIFEEKRPGFVSHSTTSLVLLEDDDVRSAVQYT